MADLTFLPLPLLPPPALLNQHPPSQKNRPKKNNPSHHTPALATTPHLTNTQPHLQVLPPHPPARRRRRIAERFHNPFIPHFPRVRDAADRHAEGGGVGRVDGCLFNLTKNPKTHQPFKPRLPRKRHQGNREAGKGEKGKRGQTHLQREKNREPTAHAAAPVFFSGERVGAQADVGVEDGFEVAG